MNQDDDDAPETFEFRSDHKDYLAPNLGLAYPLPLTWFAEQFPDLLETIQHDITVNFERSKADPIVFTASHYSLSKNWNLIVRSVKEVDLTEVRARLEKELPEMLRTWFHETIRDAKHYQLRHFWIICAANRFEFGNSDEK